MLYLAGGNNETQASHWKTAGDTRLHVQRNQMNTAIVMTEAQKTSIRSLEKALALLRSVQSLEGTDKDSVEYLLERALENLRANK